VIAVAKQQVCASDLQTKFLEILPQIESEARFAFRHRPRQYRQDLIAEAVARAWLAFVALARRRKDGTQYPTALAKFAVLAVKAGRPIGHAANANDLWQVAAKLGSELRIESLDQQPPGGLPPWREVLIEKKGFPPPEVAAARIDLAAWLASLPSRQRRIAESLARGAAPSEVARAFKLSRGRISQLRRSLANSWETFQGGALAVAA